MWGRTFIHGAGAPLRLLPHVHRPRPPKTAAPGTRRPLRSEVLARAARGPRSGLLRYPLSLSPLAALCPALWPLA